MIYTEHARVCERPGEGVWRYRPGVKAVVRCAPIGRCVTIGHASRLAVARAERDRFAMFAYAARCSVAAIAGWHLSAILGIGEPVWAAMSALIISQVGLRETRLYSKERIAGSALGIVLSLAIHVAPSMSSVPLTIQVAAAVGICALIAYRWPSLRVAMWTCPIVLLPSSHNGAVLGIGIERGLAVIVGASVALLFHWLAEKWPAPTSRRS